MIYNYTILPIEHFLSLLLSLLAGVTGSYVFALVLLSVVVRLLTTPLEKFANKAMKHEQIISLVLSPQLKKIKQAYAGSNRHEAIKRLYKRYGYHPIYAIRSVMSLLVQLPFFIGAYHMIDGASEFQGVIVPIIGDLGKPDELLWGGVNLFPFIMTAINLLALFNTPRLSRKNIIQGVCIALIFLVLLYASPVALLVYWTTNNLISLLISLVSRFNFVRSKIFLFIQPLLDINKNILVLFSLICITFFITTPFHMLGGNLVEAGFVDFPTFFLTALFCSFCLVLPLLTIAIIGKIVKKEDYVIIGLNLIFFWVFFAGIFFPLAASSGMIDLKDNPMNFANLAIVIILSTLALCITHTRLKNTLYLFCISIIVYTTLSSVFNVWKADIPQSNQKDALTLSSQKNILVISFDGLPGSIVEEILQEDQKLANSFKDFVLFNNAVSQSPATSASIMGELHGIHKYKEFGTSPEEIYRNIKEEEITPNLLSSVVDDTYHFGLYPYAKKMRLASAKNRLSHRKLNTILFFHYPVARVITPVIYASFNQFLDKCSKKFSFLIVEETKYRKEQGPGWNVQYIKEIDNYDYFIKNLTSKRKKKALSIRRGHFTFTHFPVSFDDECNYRSNDKDWFRSNQNEAGVKNEVYCAVSKFAALIQKLKELDIYDQSLIVFKSDHGKPVGYPKTKALYFDSEPNNLKINGNRKWGYNRYRPLLLIKDFQVKRNKIQVEEQLVILNDLARTLCEKAEANNDCSVFPGINIIDDKQGKDSNYYLYVVSEKNTSFKFEDHIEVEIDSRKVSLLDAMKESEEIILSTQNSPDKGKRF
jgi:YidC/Oxa1 family membrane protein insertase